MAAVGGSITEVSLDGRIFAPTADSDVTIKLGGFENEVLSNGNGSVRQIKTRVPMSVTGLAIEIDADRGDQEFLQSLADRLDHFPITLVMASGVVYQGVASITDSLESSTGSASATMALMGPGTLTQQ